MGKKASPKGTELAFRSTAFRLSEGLQSRAGTRALQDDLPMTEI